MIKKIHKNISVGLLIFIDFLAINFAVYISASIIETNFISYLKLFLYFSILFLIITIPINFIFRNYSYLNRSFGIENIKNILYGSLLIFIIIYLIKLIFDYNSIKIFFYSSYFFSLTNILNQIVLFCFMSVLFRFVISKISIYFFYSSKKKPNNNVKFALYGAGRSGLAYLDNLIRNNSNLPQFIIDDDINKIGRFINSIKIISLGEFEEFIKNNKYQISQVILCIPSLSSIKKDNISRRITNLNLKFVANERNNYFDSLSNIITDIKNKSENIKDEISEDVSKYFEQKVVIITGAGGSIGKEICYKLSMLNIKTLIAIDIDEYRLSKINRELNVKQKKFNYVNYLLDVNNYLSLKKIYEKHKPEFVFHAAASKHVDIVEKNWFYGSNNNIQTTYNICKCSFENKVLKTIFISTDKAVEPINFLGISKAVGERIIKMYSSKDDKCHFSSIRFGNVIGSSGSLLDSIKDQLKISNVINVTDKNMKRYFMTISDAVSLVLISTKISKSGDCHILKMGEKVKILDIVEDIIKQHNLENQEHSKVKINFTGIRPGEKIEEKLFYEDKIEKTENKFILNENWLLAKSSISIEDFIQKIQDPKLKKDEFKNELLKFIN